MSRSYFIVLIDDRPTRRDSKGVLWKVSGGKGRRPGSLFASERAARSAVTSSMAHAIRHGIAWYWGDFSVVRMNVEN